MILCQLLSLILCLPVDNSVGQTGLSDRSERRAPFEFLDGDRVVWLGGTFVERSQRYGYIETTLLRRYPDRNIVFRNLGWSGDTVWAESRGLFDPPEQGYRDMMRQIQGLKPTVILVNYGNNESFAGEAGLPRFVDQMDALLDGLERTGAEIVLMSPHPHEDLGPPLPSAEQRNANLALYSDAIAGIARRRGLRFCDLFASLRAPGFPSFEPENARGHAITSNGIHLHQEGYRYAAGIMEQLLAPPEEAVEVRSSQNGDWQVHGASISDPKRTARGLSFSLALDRLPGYAASWQEPPGQLQLRIEGLPAGDYRLSVDGQVIATCPGAALAHGVALPIPAEQAQLERLRQAIVVKNKLYFFFWRPQNVTYLFLFRKHEQGQNAAEVAEFDRLVLMEEQEINDLKRPVRRLYNIEPVDTP